MENNPNTDCINLTDQIKSIKKVQTHIKLKYEEINPMDWTSNTRPNIHMVVPKKSEETETSNILNNSVITHPHDAIFNRL